MARGTSSLPGAEREDSNRPYTKPPRYGRIRACTGPIMANIGSSFMLSGVSTKRAIQLQNICFYAETETSRSPGRGDRPIIAPSASPGSRRQVSVPISFREAEAGHLTNRR